MAKRRPGSEQTMTRYREETFVLHRARGLDQPAHCNRVWDDIEQAPNVLHKPVTISSYRPNPTPFQATSRPYYYNTHNIGDTQSANTGAIGRGLDWIESSSRPSAQSPGLFDPLPKRSVGMEGGP